MKVKYKRKKTIEPFSTGKICKYLHETGEKLIVTIENQFNKQNGNSNIKSFLIDKAKIRKLYDGLKEFYVKEKRKRKLKLSVERLTMMYIGQIARRVKYNITGDTNIRKMKVKYIGFRK